MVRQRAASDSDYASECAEAAAAIPAESYGHIRAGGAGGVAGLGEERRPGDTVGEPLISHSVDV